MITRGGMSEISYYRMIRELGISEEYFYTLPLEIQKALIMSGMENNKRGQINELRKKMALKQYDFEEKVKEKVLNLFKKNK